MPGDARNALVAGAVARLSAASGLWEHRAEVSPQDLRQLVAEQRALRRVATLVAAGADAQQLFAAAAAEVGGVLGAAGAGIGRYDGDEAVVILAGWRSDEDAPATFGLRLALDGDSVAARVRQTGRPARTATYAGGAGEIAQLMQKAWPQFEATIGAPIHVGGELWGVMIITQSRGHDFPAGTEERLTDFTELIGIAVANAAAAEDLAASRARVVAAADAARRRLQRDLHDGAQQQIVSLALRLRGAERERRDADPAAAAELASVADALEAILHDLQELSRGLHPVVLSSGGLAGGLRQLARRSAVPVRLDVGVEGRLSEPVELAAYYVTAEALANAAKHAHATAIEVASHLRDGTLVVTISDDGAGGADASHGSGLVGLRDRVEALGGTIAVTSPSGAGTLVEMRLPAVGAPSPEPVSSPS